MTSGRRVLARPEGRRERRKRETRAKLLQAAHAVISKVGVDAATIQEITVAADVGFGTFYSYFETKDQLASALLDCMIHDVGQRNADVTADITHTAPETLPAVRTKLMLRTGVNDPLWRWWALHPQMLFDRLDNGLGAYAKADIRSGIAAGELSITEDDVDVAWRLALWAMVGALHDDASRSHDPQFDARVTEAVLRLLGTPAAKAKEFAALVLPDLPPSQIDWDFAVSGG